MALEQTGPTLVVLAAGMGTRYGGLKQITPLGPAGNVLLEYTASDAIRAGFRNIVFVIRSDFSDDFAALVSRIPNDVSVQFALQDTFWPEGVPRFERAKPWGTAHALLAAKDLVHGPFALCNADDYYGASAFEAAAGFLGARDSGSVSYGMVGYRLAATLSGHGSVSRAVCAMSDRGRLTSVCEHSNILRNDGIITGENDADGKVALSDDNRVSMNLWLLTPSIFGFLDAEVRDFIDRHRDSPSAECQLPGLINQLLRHGEITVDCLPHDDEWFGLTHSADRRSAATRIHALHEDGTYPTPLWQDDGPDS